MPATFAICQNCGYRFNYDYDLRPGRCPHNSCQMPFDWDAGNPSQTESPRGDAGSGGGVGLGAPILPGEPGHEEYARSAREEHDASSMPYGEDGAVHDIDTSRDRSR